MKLDIVPVIVDGKEYHVSKYDLKTIIPELDLPILNEEQLCAVNMIYCLMDWYEDEMGNSTFGPLHIVLDDLNIEDHYIQSCYIDCQNINDPFGMLLCQLLLLLPTNVREAVLENRFHYEESLNKYYNTLKNRLSEYYTNKRNRELELRNEQFGSGFNEY